VTVFILVKGYVRLWSLSKAAAKFSSHLWRLISLLWNTSFGIQYLLLRLNRAGREKNVWGKEGEARQTLSQAQLNTGTDLRITGLNEEVWKGPATVKNKRLLRCLLIST